MLIQFDPDLKPIHFVTYASQAFVDHMHQQTDVAFVHLAEDWPPDEIELARDPGSGAVQAFHVPPGGIRREIAQKAYAPNPTLPLPPRLTIEEARAEALRQVDGYYGRQAVLRYPLAAIHAQKAVAAVSAPDQLQAEATERGIAVADLAGLIGQKAEGQTAEIMALDMERRGIKRDIAAADSLEALDAILSRFGG